MFVQHQADALHFTVKPPKGVRAYIQVSTDWPGVEGTTT
jgi:hypothetical protein